MSLDSRIVDAIQKPSRNEREVVVDGTSLYVYTDNNVIEVRSSPSGLGSYFFRAHRVTHFPNKHYVEFSIRTKLPDDSRYPGIYASELWRLAIAYFNKKKRVDGIYTEWENRGDNDNYKQYKQYLSQGLQPTDAAKYTWTGNQAAALGFHTVRQVLDDRDMVSFIFEK